MREMDEICALEDAASVYKDAQETASRDHSDVALSNYTDPGLRLGISQGTPPSNFHRTIQNLCLENAQLRFNHQAKT